MSFNYIIKLFLPFKKIYVRHCHKIQALALNRHSLTNAHHFDTSKHWATILTTQLLDLYYINLNLQFCINSLPTGIKSILLKTQIKIIKQKSVSIKCIAIYLSAFIGRNHLPYSYIYPWKDQSKYAYQVMCLLLLPGRA